MNIINSEISSDFKDKFYKIINKYSEIFHTKGEIVPPSSIAASAIELEPGVRPLYCSPYKTSESERKEIQRHIEELVEHNIIEPARSPWAFPVVLVKEGQKDSSGNKETRMVIDLRRLNQVVTRNTYTIPRTDQIFHTLRAAKYWSTLDLKSAFFQIRLRPECSKIITFCTELGNYSYLRLSFGLNNSPSIYQRTQNTVFSDYLNKFVIIYLDDIIIYSDSLESQLNHLELIFIRLKEVKMTLNSAKCRIAYTRIKILGHYLSIDGLSPDPAKIEAIQNIRVPLNQKQLRSFLGLCGFYRRYIE